MEKLAAKIERVDMLELENLQLQKWIVERDMAEAQRKLSDLLAREHEVRAAMIAKYSIGEADQITKAGDITRAPTP